MTHSGAGSVVSGRSRSPEDSGAAVAGAPAPPSAQVLSPSAARSAPHPKGAGSKEEGCTRRGSVSADGRLIGSVAAEGHVEAAGDLLSALVIAQQGNLLDVLEVGQAGSEVRAVLKPGVLRAMRLVTVLQSWVAGYLLAQMNVTVFVLLNEQACAAGHSCRGWHVCLFGAFFLGMSTGGALAGLVQAASTHRFTVLISTALMLLTALSTVVSTDRVAVTWERFLCGLCTGCGVLCLSVYVSRCATFTRSRVFGALYQIAHITGVLTAYLLGLGYLGPNTLTSLGDRSDTSPWSGSTWSRSTLACVWIRVSVMPAVVGLMVALRLFYSTFRFETPHDYVRRADYANAKAMLRCLYEVEEAEHMDTLLCVIKLQTDQQSTSHTGSCSRYLRNALHAFFQQASGFNALLAASTALFYPLVHTRTHGLRLAILLTLAMGAGGWSVTLITGVLLDKWMSKKPIILIAVALQVVVASILSWLHWGNNPDHVIVTGCLWVLFICLHCMGYGTVTKIFDPSFVKPFQQDTVNPVWPGVSSSLRWFIACCWTVLAFTVPHLGWFFIAVAVSTLTTWVGVLIDLDHL
ncbi:major facilitator superfamily transporter [Gregarina niphandrodes]|uniref:Major facilitator superfamily transporter n=1 Tax=Gregarina niphandrodes TaxID=110365 RepID=A0A023B9U7_GRENI|nr:major facilitator superfamily transporter [Gregarina niphandrodes]EZG75882.1 major facilitator superfamily transporter [Gregarina niphandrodes]|eukprot:XP_011129599.1 major facilitator superfamily transporter [Gregarina niphandrodes]